jgi:hypothetical protein
MQNRIDIDADQTGYKIGYGKPPKHSRFKKGQSGNPRGRKRSFQSAGWENSLRKYLFEYRTVRIDGKKQTLQAMDILAIRVLANALGGCPKNIKLVVDTFGGFRGLLEEQKRQMTEADRALIEATLGSWMLGIPRANLVLPVNTRLHGPGQHPGPFLIAYMRFPEGIL